MIRLLLADDHVILRAGLAELFAGVLDISLVGQAGSAPGLLELLERIEAEVLLLDLNMPGTSGLDLISQVLARRPGLAVLVLTMNSAPAVVQRALDFGAAGFVSKGCDIQTLLAAIRALARGERYIEPSLAQRMVLAHKDVPAERLTRREEEVLALIVDGLRLGEIADRLFLSAKTVSTHKMNLMRKLGVDNNADLIRRALRREEDAR